MKLRKLFLFVVFFVMFLNQVFGNLLFSEILPNTDDDANLEYIELYNSTENVLFLSGYILKDTSEKEFVFDSSYFLNAYEKKKYLRQETKIILNNTDEQLFLYDNFGNLLDSYSYANSEKGKVIVIYGYTNNEEVFDETVESFSGTVEEVIDDTIDTQTGIVDDENSTQNETLTGVTDEVGVETQSGIIDSVDTYDVNSNSGSIDTQSGTLEKDNLNPIQSNTGTSTDSEYNNDINQSSVLLPNIEFSFQVPTYLVEKEQILGVYNCDTSKEECKINLDLRNSFVGEFNESDYLCNLDFGFETGEENKCNPGSIIVPVGTYDFKIKIIDKNNSQAYVEKSIQVKNRGYIKPVISSSSIYINNVYNDTSIINISKPEIIIQSGINSNNECTNKKACSINLNYEVKNSKERCLWDFGNSTYDSGTEQKCNPGYVKYSNGNFVVKLKVYQEGNINNFSNSELRFSNLIDDEKVESKIDEIKEKHIEENKEIEYVLPYNETEKSRDLSGLRIFKLMVNPEGSDDFEYIEIINNSDEDFDMSFCKLDDILESGSKAYQFSKGDIIKKGTTKKYYKEVTKLNLNNDNDEVNLFCDEVLVDKLSWDFKVKESYYLDHSRLDKIVGKAKVLEVIDTNTLEVQFLSSNKVEKLKMIGIYIPDVEKSDVELYKISQEAYDYVNDSLSGQEIEVEMDINNYRDEDSNLLGIVNIDGKIFNKELIELGYAKSFLFDEFRYSDDYKKAESIAKKDKLGIWAIGLENNNSVLVSKKLVEKSKGTGALESIITIQGKIGKNKTIIGNSIICFDTCSINFDGTESTGNIKKYNWDFGNGQKFSGKNPKSIKYEKFGNYKVYLAVIGENGELNIGEFKVNFYKTPKKQKSSSIVDKVDAGYDEKDEESELNNLDLNVGNKSFLIYILIGIFGLGLVFMLLKKEKML